MDQASELVKLCEGWWKGSSSDEERDLRACVAKYFGFLGWDSPETFESAFLDASGFVKATDGIS